MQLARFLKKSRIIDVKSVDFRGVLTELLASVPDSALGSADRNAVMRGLWSARTRFRRISKAEFACPTCALRGLNRNT